MPLTIKKARALRYRHRKHPGIKDEQYQEVVNVALADAYALWVYLASHGDIIRKFDVPWNLFAVVQKDMNFCPLCSVYRVNALHCDPACPLTYDGTTDCASVSSLVMQRYNTQMLDTPSANARRATIAQAIANRIKEAIDGRS